MTLYGTYGVNTFHKIVDAFNYLHKNVSKHEKILSDRQSFWYKGNIFKRRIAHMVLNSLLHLHELQMKYVDAYKDLIRNLCSYIDAFDIPSIGYFPMNLIPPSKLNGMTTQVK